MNRKDKCGRCKAAAFCEAKSSDMGTLFLLSGIASCSRGQEAIAVYHFSVAASIGILSYLEPGNYQPA